MSDAILVIAALLTGGVTAWAWMKFQQAELRNSVADFVRANGRLRAEIVMLNGRIDTLKERASPIPAQAPKKAVGRKGVKAKG